MKRLASAILLFDLMAGLLLLGLWEQRQAESMERGDGNFAEVWAGSGSFPKGDDLSQSLGDFGEEKTAGEERKKIALTFDDGPHPRYTEQLLDGLRDRGAAATFFVTGEHAALHPDVIGRMKEEGHLIGNHTYSHIQLTKKNREKFKEELVRTNGVISGITGEEVLYVRPPYGCWDKSLEQELNMFPVLWTIDPLDWCSSNVDCIVDRVVSRAGENEIILMHDYYDTSVTAALKIVDKLQEAGYEFVTVEEILLE